jgi:hypothetical protein
MNPHATVLEKWLNLSGRSYYVALLLGLVIAVLPVRPLLVNVVDGKNDFLQFYAGARLAGTPYLYDRARFRQEQINATGGYGPALEYFVRPPFYAALLSPLGKLSYDASLKVWQAISLAALVGFVAVWRITNTKLTVLACCWSLPLLIVFAMAQDVTLLLLLLALAFKSRGESPLATGLIMSLLAIKFNLFLLLPLLLLGQRRWRTVFGFLLGSAILTAISFTVASLDWPMQMLRTLSSGAIAPREDVFPNLRGLLQPFTNQFLPELVLDLAVASMVWIIARRSDFEYGMAAVITGSLLVSHHAGPQDAAVMIPALLIVVSRTTITSINLLCVILLTPLPYQFLTFGHGLGSMTVLPLIALLVVMAAGVTRAGTLPLSIGVREQV